MDVYGKIGSKMREISGTHKMSTNVFTAEVTEITGQTCTVKVDDMPLTDVRLRAVINSNDEQIFIRPKVGSYVTVIDLSGGNMRDLAVISYSEIDEINIKIGAQTLVMTKSGIEINGGMLGGLVKIDALISWMKNVKIDLETISKALNGLGAPVKVITGSPTKSNFEDAKVKH